MKSYKTILLFFMSVCAFMTLAGCGPEAAAKEFTFEALGDGEMLVGASQLLSLGKNFSGEESALVQGQLLGLFGDPLYVTPDLENAYMYSVLASDPKGNQYNLSVYCGPSGPAIGGDPGKKGIQEAAEALQTYIKQAKPVDYEYQGFYLDTASMIVQGVSAGRPYYDEQLMTEEEFMEALEMCEPRQ